MAKYEYEMTFRRGTAFGGDGASDPGDRYNRPSGEGWRLVSHCVTYRGESDYLFTYCWEREVE